MNNIANVPVTLAKGLECEGDDVEVITLRLIGSQQPTWVKVLLLPWRWQEIIELNRRIIAGAFDVVHLHYAYLGWAGFQGDYDYFLHCHGTDVRFGLYDLVRRSVTVRSICQAKRVFYSTPDLKEHVTAVRSDAVWLPNPVDTEQFCPLPRAEEGRRRVLFISAMSRVKGVDKAFELIDLLRLEAPDVELAVFGFGDRLRRYARWPGVTVLPPVPHADMPEVINGFDVVVGQLHLGILSMSELEAMSCGKPVVGQFHYPECYEEQPPMLTGETPEEWAAGILRLLDSGEERAALGERARRWVVKHHDYRRVAHVLREFYLA